MAIRESLPEISEPDALRVFAPDVSRDAECPLVVADGELGLAHGIVDDSDSYPSGGAALRGV